MRIWFGYALGDSQSDHNVLIINHRVHGKSERQSHQVVFTYQPPLRTWDNPISLICISIQKKNENQEVRWCACVCVYVYVCVCVCMCVVHAFLSMCVYIICFIHFISIPNYSLSQTISDLTDVPVNNTPWGHTSYLKLSFTTFWCLQCLGTE